MKIPKKSQFAIKCIFCGNVGVTEEHVISAWITREIFEKSNQYFINPYKKSNSNNKFIWDPEKTKQGQLGNMRIRIACGKCNNQWMSQIVNDAMPKLKEIFFNNHTNSPFVI